MKLSDSRRNNKHYKLSKNIKISDNINNMYHRLFFFIALLIVFQARSWAAQYAHVKTDKAVIYADQNMSTPIGQVSRGKRIAVGEVPRKYGTLLPVLVAGKIGWIQIKDIQFVELSESSKETVLEHDIIDPDTTDKLGINNHLSMVYNVFDFGEEWNDLSYAIGDEVGKRPFYMGLMFEHRPPQRRFSFSIGLSYLYQKQDNLILSAPLLELKGLVAPIKYKYFSLELTAGTLFSGSFKVDSSYNPEDEEYDNVGELIGFNYGLEFRYFPHSTFSFINGLSFQRGIITNLAPIKISNEDNDVIALERFKGTSYYFGVSYLF